MKHHRFSRRQWLKSVALTSTILMPPLLNGQTDVSKNTQKKAPDTDPHFYGQHQAGILTPQQKHVYLLSLDVLTGERNSVIQMLKTWTKFVDLKISGGRIKNSENNMIAPNDSGDADDLNTNSLTVTFGFGQTFFVKNEHDRFGLQKQMPMYLKPVPHMPKDLLNPSYCDGDIVVQVCADDIQVAFHVVRNLVRLAAGVATPKWLESGFLMSPENKTGRNLFGFKDGTANAEHANQTETVIWANAQEPKWLHNGTYLSYRKIQMRLEVWDRSSMLDHENTFGRYKTSGAAFGETDEFAPSNIEKMPEDAHVRLIKETGQKIHRRGYSYSSGINPKTGAIDAGLLFVAFTQNPITQLFPMLTLLGAKDKLNEYALHIGNGLFACPSGIQAGQYIGQTLFESS